MEDPKDIAIRVTTTAKDIVDQARAIATEAIGQSSDVDKYTAAQLADSVTKSVELAFSGALQLNRDVLGVVPKPGPSSRIRVPRDAGWSRTPWRRSAAE